MEDRQAFGEWLRQTRIEKGQASLRAFSKLVGLSSSYVSQVERGATAPPTPENLALIAGALGIPYEDILLRSGRVDEDVLRVIRDHGLQDIIRQIDSGDKARAVRALIEGGVKVPVCEDLKFVVDLVESNPANRDYFLKLAAAIEEGKVGRRVFRI